MPVKIAAHLPDQLVRTLFLREGETAVLGRAPEAQLQLPHASVSRQHARIGDDQGRWWIEDLHSKNGVRLNGHTITREWLSDRDWFAIGDVFCQFEILQFDALTRQKSRIQERRQSAAKLSEQLNQAQTGDVLLNALLRGVVELAECRRGFVLISPDGHSLKMQVAHSINPDELQSQAFSGSRGAVERAILQRRPVYSSTAADQAFLRQQASVVREGIRALVCLPLIQGGRVLGVVYADTDEAGKHFSELDAELLAAFAEQATNLLAARQLDVQLKVFEAQLERRLQTDPGMRSIAGPQDAPPRHSP